MYMPILQSTYIHRYIILLSGYFYVRMGRVEIVFYSSALALNNNDNVRRTFAHAFIPFTVYT